MVADMTLASTFSLTPDDIVREVKHLPSAPKVLPRLKVLLCDGNSSMDDIVSLVRLDPGIAARVLQLANSAYFGQGALRCATVEQAVIRVGFEQVFEMVSYAVASQVLVRPLEVYDVEADELWRMSVAGAIAAELLAEVTLQDRNIAYTAGLLHCVGMVAIDEWALRRGAKLRLISRGFPREATEHERQELGFTQAEVGSALLRHWDFPRAMSEPVRWQYAPRASAGFVRMASLLHAAKWIRSAVCAPVATLPPPLPEALQLQPMGLVPEALPGLIAGVQDRLARVCGMLETTAVPEAQTINFPTRIWRN